MSSAALTDDFIALFLRWNARINLSAARTRDELMHHVEDSRAVLPFLTGRVLDVGSGGGFPVVIAAIERPDLYFVALEPNHKKHAFLREASRTLGLRHLEARCERIEDHANTDYDLAMSRATFDLLDWLTLGRNFVRASGRIVGFEALPRGDLPVGARRFPYGFADRTRAIVEISRVD